MLGIFFFPFSFFCNYAMAMAVMKSLLCVRDGLSPFGDGKHKPPRHVSKDSPISP